MKAWALKKKKSRWVKTAALVFVDRLYYQTCSFHLKCWTLAAAIIQRCSFLPERYISQEPPGLHYRRASITPSIGLRRKRACDASNTQKSFSVFGLIDFSEVRLQLHRYRTRSWTVSIILVLTMTWLLKQRAHLFLMCSLFLIRVAFCLQIKLCSQVRTAYSRMIRQLLHLWIFPRHPKSANYNSCQDIWLILYIKGSRHLRAFVVLCRVFRWLHPERN